MSEMFIPLLPVNEAYALLSALGAEGRLTAAELFTLREALLKLERELDALRSLPKESYWKL